MLRSFQAGVGDIKNELIATGVPVAGWCWLMVGRVPPFRAQELQGAPISVQLRRPTPAIRLIFGEAILLSQLCLDPLVDAEVVKPEACRDHGRSPMKLHLEGSPEHAPSTH